MRFLPSLGSATSCYVTNDIMATDVNLSHTMDDDITFEQVRHMPRRTQFVSTHRKLSWQCDRQIKQHERDQRISHVEMARARTAMTEKLVRLKDAKKQVGSCGGERPDRRYSAPCLPDLPRADQQRTARTQAGLKQSHSASSFPLVHAIPEHVEGGQQDEAGRGGHETLFSLSGDGSEVKGRGVAVPRVPQRVPGVRTIRRATIADCAHAQRPGGPGLPPHLARRLSQFLDSTEHLLQRSTTSMSSATPRPLNDPGDVTSRPGGSPDSEEGEGDVFERGT